MPHQTNTDDRRHAWNAQPIQPMVYDPVNDIFLPLEGHDVNDDGAAAINVIVTNPTVDPETGLAKEVTLAAVLSELEQKLESGGTVALDAATLAALENTTITVDNLPANYPLPATQVADLKTVTVANPTANPETGLAKETTLASIAGYLDMAETILAQIRDDQTVTVDNFPADQAVTVSNPVTDVSVNNHPTDIAVNNFPATQAVSGPLTDTELRATAVEVTVANPTPATETGLAKETTLAEAVTRLGDIFSAVDGLEVTAENIDMSNTTLNLALDEAEELLRAIRDRATFPLPLEQVADLKTVTVSNPTANPETGLAKEVTLASINAKDFATQTTLDNIRGLLVAEDFASEATLDAIRTLLAAEDFASETTLAAINAKDLATQTTLEAVRSLLATEDFASEATLEAVRSLLAGEDFASETSLASLLNSVGARSDADTTLGVIGLLKSIKGKDFATEATLEAVRTLLSSEDFASQATLEAIRIILTEEDFATEATLATRATETTAAGTRSATEGLRADLATRDLATNATLAQIRDLLSGEDFASQATLEAIRLLLASEDFASEATLANLNSRDFASQATLEEIRLLLSGEDFASEATLMALLTKLETGLAKDATLATIRDTLYRRTDPIPAGTNIIGFVSPSPVLKVLQHKVFRAGGEVSTSVTTPNASMTLTNPVGNTKTAYLIGLAVYSDAAAPVTFYTDAESTGTLRAAENMNIGSPAVATAEVRLGAGDLSGGREWSLRARVTMNSPLVRDVFVPVAPGRSVTVRFLGPGATNLVTFNGTWYEE